MMTFNILVTGGAGFIGSHLVDKLVEEGHNVRVLDALEGQVHHKKPDYLNPHAEYIFDDIRNEIILKKSLEDIDVLFHEAAMVGVGQSMYHIQKYVDVNTFGTSKLLDIIINGNFDIKKMIVASSMSIYGEGMYTCDCGEKFPHARTKEQMKNKQWEYVCNVCRKNLQPLPTNEEKPLMPMSVYAITKRDQEELFLSIGKAYGIPTTALRYFNVFGPRQSLNNPYTGVAAIFSSHIKNNTPPLIFEDGAQSRDFVSVHDIIQSNILAMKNNKANYEAFNVGTGTSTTIKQVADILIKLYGKPIQSQISGRFREGDIRHCFADISKIRMLGFEPKIDFVSGMRELVQWGIDKEAKDTSAKALNELENKGLVSD